jgi:hypothetical protein
MKSLMLTPFLLLCLLTSCPSFAASSSEEARVIANVKKAFATRQTQPILDLYYWEGVSQKDKGQVSKNISSEVNSEKTIKSIQFIGPKPNALTEIVRSGVTYRINLPITKRLEIKFEKKDGVTSTTRFNVGEKNGKLYFVQLAPVK